MGDDLEIVLRAAAIGIGATAVIDLWAVFLRRAFGVRSMGYAMVGRWLGHMPRGRFVHQNIAKSAPIAGERVLGWAVHYLIGVLYAAILLAIWGLEWAHEPTMQPALIVGLATVVAPYLVMQPGMGLGIAVSKTPHPNIARLRSLLTHFVFGLGLYLSALALTLWNASGFGGG